LLGTTRTGAVPPPKGFSEKPACYFCRAHLTPATQLLEAAIRPPEQQSR
jgi:hypothetical protein